MNNSEELDARRRRQEDAIGLAPADAVDPVVEAFKKDVDRTLLIENLRVGPQERLERFLRGMRAFYELRKAGRRRRTTARPTGA